jgi:hypothetical protein
MIRRVLTLSLLLALGTGCPHAWGKGGSIDMALRKDLEEERKSRGLVFPCKMPQKEWLELCSDANGRMTSDACPPECRPRQ